MSHLRAISHIALTCRDLETSVEFYTAALGMTKAFEIRVPESLAAQGHPFAPLVGQVAIVYLRVGGRNYLELFRPLPDAETGRLGPNVLGMGFAHLSLEVEGLGELVESLRGRGIEIDQEMSLSLADNSYQAWIRDPDGHRIELMEYTPDSLQVAHLGDD